MENNDRGTSGMNIILFGGKGSIGRKHIDNLKILGEHNISIVDKDDPIPDTLSPYTLAIIATPTDTHLELLHLCNCRRVPYVMVEKPLCLLPTPLQQLHAMGIPVSMTELISQVFVNHAYRFERGLHKLKECFPLIGTIRHASMENSYSFQKLHPHYTWDNFDGIIYDDSHMVNTSRFLFGDPTEYLHKYVKKQIAEFTWKAGNMIVSHRTDLLSETYKKRIEVRGTLGTLVYNYGAHEIFFCPADESPRKAIAYEFVNHLFESLKYVVDTAKKGGVFEINTLEDAVKDMEVIGELTK